jgi:hypothetical protein
MEDCPSEIQRRLLDLLADGEKSDYELVVELDLDDPRVAAEVREAKTRGWITVAGTGIGGFCAVPPSMFALTENGEAARRR